MVQQESKSTDAQGVPAMKDSLDTLMSGRYWRLEEDVLGNSLIVSVCYVELPVHESDGFGTAKTMSGRKSTVNIKDDGSMSILVKRCGTTLEPTPKVCFHQHIWVNALLTLHPRLEPQDILLHRLLE